MLESLQFKDAQAVTRHVCMILADVLQKSTTSLEDRLDLNSLQTLRALSLIETIFQIEIEDDFVFHGLFASTQSVVGYICQNIGLSEAGHPEM